MTHLRFLSRWSMLFCLRLIRKIIRQLWFIYKLNLWFYSLYILRYLIKVRYLTSGVPYITWCSSVEDFPTRSSQPSPHSVLYLQRLQVQDVRRCSYIKHCSSSDWLQKVLCCVNNIHKGPGCTPHVLSTTVIKRKRKELRLISHHYRLTPWNNWE